MALVVMSTRDGWVAGRLGLSVHRTAGWVPPVALAAGPV